MSNRNIEKYFDYRGEEALVNLLEATQYIFSHSRDERLLDEILLLSNIEIPAPLFLKLIDEELEMLNQVNDAKVCHKNMIHSPAVLQDSVVTWLYYALYWAYRLDKKDEVYEYPQNLSRIVLLFHYYHLKYKKEEGKVFPQKDHCAIGLSRALEYMAAMARTEHAYFNKVYFLKEDSFDLGKHFLTIASSNAIEKNHFFIQKKLNKNENYLVYNNVSEEIKLKILSSRKIISGKDEQTQRNQKIVTYFKDDLREYEKLIDQVTKTTRDIKKGRKRKSYSRQYTEREDFDSELYRVEINASDVMTYEESQEVLQKQKKKYRALPMEDASSEEGETYVQNSDKQRKINRAFSANVTKKSLKLTSDYTIPVSKHLKQFILSLYNQNISKDFSYNDLFLTIFLLSCMTGLGYEQLVRVLWDRDDVVSLNLNENTLKVKLDETLFSKDKKSDYMEKAGKSISYLLPELIVMLIKKIKLILELSLSEIDNGTKYKILQSKQVNKWYEQYLTGRVEQFNKKIVIKPKQQWRTVEAYKKETLKEEMSTLFCVGKYQIFDRAKMAYTSAHNKGQIHAGFIASLYKGLGMHEVISAFLKEDPLKNVPKGQIDTTFKYAGSSRVLKVENSKRFFEEMQGLIIREEDIRLRFNLLSIYTKYALSILLGTRTFLHSTALDNISFHLHILSISEKASTLLSGIRVVPLCSSAEKIIKKYQASCRVMKIAQDGIYLLDTQKAVLYNQALALRILQKVEASQWLQLFVSEVPVNIGRHIITNEARERNFNGYYLEALLGHYGSGEEQLGVFSTLDMQDYIYQCRKLIQKVADKYGVNPL